MWYSLMEDDRQEGPLTLSALHELIRKGRITRDTLVWQQGMPDWLPAGHLPQLGGVFGQLRPAPAPAPAPAAKAQGEAHARAYGPKALTETLATTQPDAQRHAHLGPLPERPPEPLATVRQKASDPADLASFLFEDLSGPREPSVREPTAPNEPAAVTAKVVVATSAAELPPEETTLIVATRPSELEEAAAGFLGRWRWDSKFTPMLGGWVALSLVIAFAIALWNYR